MSRELFVIWKWLMVCAVVSDARLLAAVILNSIVGLITSTCDANPHHDVFATRS